MEKVISEEINMLADDHFKDTVLESAQNKATEIISAVQQNRAQILEKAKKDMPEANYEEIASAYQQKYERLLAAEEQKNRIQILQTREQLVAEVFEEVRAELEKFAQSQKYLQWMQSKMQALLLLVENQETTLLLRSKDIEMASSLQAKLSNCKVQADDSIVLGGFKLICKNKMYNETFEEYFAQQKEAFYTAENLQE